MDSIAAEPTIEITVRYACSCVDRWMVYQLGAEEAVHLVDLPCVPELCGQCARDGMCETRKGMLNYRPVQFTEVVPVGRKRYVRMKSTAVA